MPMVYQTRHTFKMFVENNSHNALRIFQMTDSLDFLLQNEFDPYVSKLNT